MFTFISKANELQEFNFNNSNICNGKNTYSKLVCIYYNALLKSHYQNINDGDIICKNIDNKLIGKVTSGTFSPVLKKGIGLAYINSKNLKDDLIYIKIRNNLSKAEIVKTPFI